MAAEEQAISVKYKKPRLKYRLKTGGRLTDVSDVKLFFGLFKK